jgi:transposase
MWMLSGVRRILAYREPVDLRKSFLGLVGLVKGVVAEDPLSGRVFVFINRRGTVITSVSWERTGFCLVAKRWERGRLRLPGEGPRQE